MTFARIRALAIVGVLVVAAIVLVTISIVGDKQTRTVAATCPKDAVHANTTLADPQNIKLKVYNASDQAGLAKEIASELKAREFKVDPNNVGNLGTQVDGVALLRYGPKTVGAAQVVRAYFLNHATMQFDIKRQDDLVDVVLGPAFTQLATPTEEKQALAQAGRATPPAGTCDPNST